MACRAACAGPAVPLASGTVEGATVDNQKRALRATLARFHSMSLVLACSCTSTIGSWTGTRSGQRAVSPSRSEGNRTRRWRMAGTLSSRKSVGRLSAVAAEASTWSLDCSLCAQRRSRSDPAWSTRHQCWLSRHSSAARAPILRCQCAQAWSLERNEKMTVYMCEPARVW